MNDLSVGKKAQPRWEFLAFPHNLNGKKNRSFNQHFCLNKLLDLLQKQNCVNLENLSEFGWILVDIFYQCIIIFY